MSTQTEHALEKSLVEQLCANGYEKIVIRNDEELLANLKKQLEKHNQKTFSDNEFEHIFKHLTSRNNVFAKAKILRDQFAFKNDKNASVWINFFNIDFWWRNQYQVAQQIRQEGIYKNRYDVTILINGLPLLQIELKRSGLELQKAYDQIKSYYKHSHSSSATSLFQFIQLFVISNGTHTKYYANGGNTETDFKQTFYWTDKDNKHLTTLEEFANTFLAPCHLSKMITKYMVTHKDKRLMVLRPYQVYAIESIVDRVENTKKNGYIWHTTGSGKTLTSFKVSQILSKLPHVDKVVFCVDRKALDNQTVTEFNHFKADCVDLTENTVSLVKQLKDEQNKLVVTTIQKLHKAITEPEHAKILNALQEKKIVFIFDECHRSQFGKIHQEITSYFKNYQLFGFTGTPIFVENALNNRPNQTTASLFEKKLHQYVITDAIKDGNVLKFSVEYIGNKYQERKDSKNNIDIEVVEHVDKPELMENSERIEKIVHYILQQYPSKTHEKKFNAMFCVNSIDGLIKYYDALLRLKKEGNHGLKLATIFSYAGYKPLEDDMYRREKLDLYIDEYNETFGTKYSTKEQELFDNYYRDVAQRMRDREIDLLVVVNMFLTGFDSKKLNTLFVDKNLRYHGLIQAYSRTNRIYGNKKSHGNIVVFRDLKQATDDAIALFADKEAKETIVMESYEQYIQKIDKAYDALLSVAPTVDAVNNLKSEKKKFAFVEAFRNLIRIHNIITSFADFSYDHIAMKKDAFEGYQLKYNNIYANTRSSTQKEKKVKNSMLEEIDFELELIRRDEINVPYILGLLFRVNKEKEKESYPEKLKEILAMIDREPSLHNQKELLKEFILKHLPFINKENIENFDEKYKIYQHEAREKAKDTLIKKENMNRSEFEKFINKYLFSNKMPPKDDFLDLLVEQPYIDERLVVRDRIYDEIRTFIQTYVDLD